MLSDHFLTHEKLIEASARIRRGEKMVMPPEVRASILESIRRAAAASAPQPAARAKPVSRRTWAILGTAAFILFLLLHPWPHYQLASLRNKVEGYEAFVERFPQRSLARKAKEKIRLLKEDDVWASAADSGTIDKLRGYLTVYPDGKHRAAAEARLEELYNDWKWVRERDSLEHYQRFVSRFPAHPEREWIEKRIIDLEVSKIAAGEYGAMPRAEALRLGGAVVEVEVKNETGYELTVRYSGPGSTKLVIPEAGTRSVSLVPGDYRVAASVNARNVTNYYGTDSMVAGTYSSSFFIRSEYGDSRSRSFLDDLR